MQASDDMTNEGVGSEQEAIQSAQLGSGAFARSAVMFTNDTGTAATGAVHVPLGKRDDGTPVRGTCGVTFISPHFAITASHCVSKNFPTGGITTSTKLKVEHYDATGLTKAKVDAQAVVHGSFPSYTRDPLTAAEGYGVTTYNQCFVRRRCSTNDQYGRDACPLSANDSADIALLECTDRSVFGAYVPVASSDTLGEAVRMYWYHEVLNLPAKDPNSSGSTQDRWEHYGAYLTDNEPGGVDHRDRGENFHYFGGNHNQL
jgi:hypothetical protein